MALFFNGLILSHYNYFNLSPTSQVSWNSDRKHLKRKLTLKLWLRLNLHLRLVLLKLSRRSTLMFAALPPLRIIESCLRTHTHTLTLTHNDTQTHA
jgi:hypothetical protein